LVISHSPGASPLVPLRYFEHQEPSRLFLVSLVDFPPGGKTYAEARAARTFA